MTKYHINSKGLPAVCRATKRPCPLGDADSHFNSKEEAENFITEQNEIEFGIIPEDDVDKVDPEKFFEQIRKDNESFEEFTEKKGISDFVNSLSAYNKSSIIGLYSSLDNNKRIKEVFSVSLGTKKNKLTSVMVNVEDISTGEIEHHNTGYSSVEQYAEELQSDIKQFAVFFNDGK